MLMETPPTLADLTERPVVLVIDDEYGPRESVAYTLSSEFEVVTADRPAEGIKRVQERAFSVVILDIRMPEMDGIRVLEAIRKMDREVSVVMLTGFGTLQTAQQSMLHGANQYLRKPPDVAELLQTVRNQAQAAKERRYQAQLNRGMEAMNAALKREIDEKQPHIWQGRAAVELVHDLANPLTVLIGYSTLLVQEAKKVARREPEEGEKLLNYADVVSRAAEYCHELADNWKQTSRKSTEFSDVDLVDVAQHVKDVIFFSNPAIQIRGHAPVIVCGSQFELTRVFQNLFKNGLEAGATCLDVCFTQLSQQWEVAVSDNGPGMDAATAKLALKGGFTTKSHGTGLGLGICRHLLGAHGASLTLESELGRGTTLRMVFPARQ
jgi:signal transduction histidine kinase